MKRTLRMKKVIGLLIVSLVILVACSKEADLSLLEQQSIDRSVLVSYLNQNHITATETESGLFYVIENEGTGDEYPDDDDDIAFRYEGSLIDGTVFNMTPGLTVDTTNMSSLIDGLKEGFMLLKEGGTAQFYLPSWLGNGSMETENIPSNSCLIFDVELVSILDD